jgi:hypothetical protein
VEDDWTGLADSVARRKRQNRLNQRAYREYPPSPLVHGIMFVIIFSRKDAWIFTEFEAP